MQVFFENPPGAKATGDYSTRSLRIAPCLAAPETAVTPSGLVLDPALDKIKRPPVCDPTADGDGDGIANEIDGALVDYMEFYLLNYFKPATGQSTPRTRKGTR